MAGIKLNSAKLKLKASASPLEFNLSSSTIQLWKRAEGLILLILTIEPVAGWEKLLGAEK